MNNQVREAYEHFAATYDQNRGLFNMDDIFNSFYSQLRAKSGHLLDLGCGAGEPVSKMFIQHGWQVTGVDFSNAMLALAAKYVPAMKTINADMCSVDFEPDQFNAVTAIYSLFHLSSPDQFALLERIFSWLKPGGSILFSYATKEYTGASVFDGYKTFMGEQLYYSHRTPQELYSRLEQIGYGIDSREYRDIGEETFLWVVASRN